MTKKRTERTKKGMQRYRAQKALFFLHNLKYYRDYTKYNYLKSVQDE